HHRAVESLRPLEDERLFHHRAEAIAQHGAREPQRDDAAEQHDEGAELTRTGNLPLFAGFLELSQRGGFGFFLILVIVGHNNCPRAGGMELRGVPLSASVPRAIARIEGGKAAYSRPGISNLTGIAWINR